MKAPVARKNVSTGAVPDDKALLVKLAKARASLAMDQPFFGALTMGMEHKLANVGTACVSTTTIYWDRKFLAMLSDAEVLFVEAHECLHPMLGHPWRRGARNHKKWNYAGDYLINDILTTEKIGKMPEMGLLNADIVRAGKTTEGIYALLPDDFDSGEPDGTGEGTPMDDCLDDDSGSDSDSDRRQREDEWKVRVAQAAQTAKLMGKMSAGLERMVTDFLNPLVDWREVLRRFVEKCRTDTRSFARPNRRFIAQGLYLPVSSGEQMGELAFAIDCSGSIGEKELNQFAAEMNAVKDWLNPSKLHVIYFDSEVCHYDSFGQEDQLHVEPHGGGGTAFSPVFRHMAKNGIEPVATVFLTDLCCSDFGPAPDHPVLWVSTHDGEAPFGEVVRMHL